MTALLVLAGCDTAAGRPVASAQTPTAAAEGAPSPVPVEESNYDKALRFTRCMTGSGVAMSDPVEGQTLHTGLIWGPGVTAADMQLRMAALERCKGFLPRTWPVKLDPQEIERSRKFALCMRDNAIPEPLADANGVVDQPTDDALYRMPGYAEAVARCRHVVDDPANDHQP